MPIDVLTKKKKHADVAPANGTDRDLPKGHKDPLTTTRTRAQRHSRVGLKIWLYIYIYLLLFLVKD